MHVVAITETGAEASDVQAVDVWFSPRRGAWMVERFDADGRQVGPAHCCASEADAEDCLEAWLRAHAEVRLVERGDTSSAARRIVRRAARRAA